MNKYQEALDTIKNITYVPNNGIEQDSIGYWYDKEIKILQELVDLATPMKPIKKHYEEKGEESYIKYSCPNGCRIQLIPVTEKNLVCESRFCRKCGQVIDWSKDDEKTD